jgi:hypothetical protein
VPLGADAPQDIAALVAQAIRITKRPISPHIDLRRALDEFKTPVIAAIQRSDEFAVESFFVEYQRIADAYSALGIAGGRNMHSHISIHGLCSGSLKATFKKSFALRPGIRTPILRQSPSITQSAYSPTRLRLTTQFSSSRSPASCQTASTIASEPAMLAVHTR